MHIKTTVHIPKLVKKIKTLEFKRFNSTDYDFYKSVYKTIEPASDYSLNNMLVWLDLNNDLCMAKIGQCVVLKYTCPFLGNKLVFSVIGTFKVMEAIESTFAYQNKIGLDQELIMIPQTIVKNLKHSELKRLNISEDNENFDYIYSVKEKSDLMSDRAGKFRRTINRFIRDYGENVKIREVDLTDHAEVERLVNALHIWKSGNVVSNNDKLGIEGIAIDRYLKNRHHLKPHCLEVFVEDKLVGFSIYHYPPQEGFAIINHIKCDYSYTNIFEFIFFCIMSHLRMDGITYANGEQDLGIEGIRDFKHKLQPVDFIKRYTIKPN